MAQGKSANPACNVKPAFTPKPKLAQKRQHFSLRTRGSYKRRAVMAFVPEVPEGASATSGAFSKYSDASWKPLVGPKTPLSMMQSHPDESQYPGLAQIQLRVWYRATRGTCPRLATPSAPPRWVASLPSHTSAHTRRWARCLATPSQCRGRRHTTGRPRCTIPSPRRRPASCRGTPASAQARATSTGFLPLAASRTTAARDRAT